jgi:hypothetical protein
MNTTTAGPSPGPIAEMAGTHPLLTWVGGALLAAGIGLGYIFWTPSQVAAPAPASHSLWLTPKAQIVERIGTPYFGSNHTRVPMEHFQKHVENGPYVVSEGSPGSDYVIYYIAKKPETDFHIYATEVIPWSCPGFRCTTRFDGRSTFNLTVGERRLEDFYAGRTFAIAVFAVGLLLLGFAYFQRRNRWT